MKEDLKEGLFSCLFEDSGHAVVGLDSEGNIQACSQAMTQLTALPLERIKGEPFSSLFPEKADAENILQMAKSHSILKNFQCVIRHKNQGRGRVFATARALEKGVGYFVEFSPALEEMGATADNATIEETLIKMERFSAVGRMTAAFAHEMRTPIHVISSTAELLLGGLPPESPARENLSMILRNAEHAGLSIRALLDFSKGGKSKLKKGSLNDLFKTTLRLTEKLFEKEGITVKMSLGPAPDILMDAPNMRAVVHSVLVNAVESMSVGGVLQVRTGISEKTKGACFSVQDNGIGMSSEILARIGAAFFTTKEEGTGLGLYLTKRVLAEHGAAITFASTQNEGTIVTVDFPADA